MDKQVEAQLAEAGHLLRQWRDEHMYDTVSVAEVKTLPLAEAQPQASGRRPWVMGAAAALVVLAGAVAVVLATRGDDGLPVASAPSVVAFVPGSLDGWQDVRTGGPHVASEGDVGMIVVARSGTDPVDGQFVHLTTFEGVDPTELTTMATSGPIDVGGREGWWMAGIRPSLLVTEPEGHGSGLLATRGSNVTEDELIELVQAFDPALEVDGQTVPEGWTLEVDADQMPAAQSRTVELSRPGDSGDDGPSTWVTILTSSGVEPRTVQWFLASSTMQAVEIRGAVGWLADQTRTGMPGAFWSLTWAEGPQTAVSLTLTSEDHSLDAAALLSEVAEGLVGLTAAEWDEFVEQHPRSGSAISTGDGVGPTETTIESDGGSTPVFPSPGPSSHYLEGQFDNGLHFQFYVPDGTDQICWRFEGQDNAYCEDPAGDLGIDGVNSAKPRFAMSPDGAAILVYAALPPGAVDLRVTAVGPTDEVEMSLIVGEQIWVAERPDGYLRAYAVYLDSEGEIIAQASTS